MRFDPIALIAQAPLPWLARCAVPEDLAEVSHIGEEETPIGGDVELEAIERIWRTAEALYRTGITPALQLCIRHRGRVVLDRTLGHARGNAPGDPPKGPKVLATGETPFCVFSSSKMVTAMVIHKLDELGTLHLEDRVCDYIPEFARHGKQWITLRHLLAHRAGIPNIPTEAMDLDLLQQPDRVAELICEMEPASRAGRMVAYHAISGGFVLGEVVRRAAGSDIREVLSKEICEPLGLRWMRYGVAPEDLDRVALDAATGPPPPPGVKQMLQRALGVDIADVVEFSNDPRFRTGIIPSANVITTANELTVFLDCLRQGGQYGDTRIFEERTVRHALSEQSYREIDLTLFLPLRYGLGPMLGDDPVGIFGQQTGRAFGHLGFSNVFPWADPAREISVALLTSGKAILSAHVVRLVQLLSEINSSFPRQDRPAAAA
jgi:CubicO group peptidase (beta-lactamase class C family)